MSKKHRVISNIWKSTDSSRSQDLKSKNIRPLFKFKYDKNKKIICPGCGNDKLHIYQGGKLECPECQWFFTTPLKMNTDGQIWISGWELEELEEEEEEIDFRAKESNPSRRTGRFLKSKKP